MMYFLDVCTDSSFLSMILLMKNFIEIVCIIVPILLILLSSIDVGKIVINPDPKNSQKAISMLIKRSIAAVTIFFLPTIVGVFLSLLGKANYTTTACWNNANTDTINSFRETEKLEKEAEEQEKKAIKEAADAQRLIDQAAREAQREENAANADKAAANANPFSSGTATGLAAKMIAMAQNEYNNRDQYRLPYRYTERLWAIGGTYDYAWCAAFVAVMSKESGVNEKVQKLATGVWSYKSHFQSGANGIRYELSAGHGGTYVPKTGDYIFFDWDGLPNAPDGPDHIGLVKGISGDKVLIIDGNYGGSIADRSMLLTDKDIIGYGVWE